MVAVHPAIAYSCCGVAVIGGFVTIDGSNPFEKLQLLLHRLQQTCNVLSCMMSHDLTQKCHGKPKYKVLRNSGFFRLSKEV
ncbi:MAG: hypothetical protein RMX96_28680 [Nostoc sp. ChiSLP02]|nr:hypothetical protein [Nostoc sp. DedSLP05]MDZ8100723.1 hypothetical protein [Nostoc sp. DedSLP01]MDZ8188815.1 hypothetical protein [Nostoc sp. ChiSLP02]